MNEWRKSYVNRKDMRVLPGIDAHQVATRKNRQNSRLDRETEETL